MNDLFQDGARYNSIGPWLKNYFGRRMVKLSIDGGFTCPNRDGTLSRGGCLFCSEKGSGDCAGSRQLDIHSQMRDQISLLENKWQDFGIIAYFQNFTNTYAPVQVLREKYEMALSFPGCQGLAIATRPDCISPEALDLLTELSRRTFLWVELGLQTSKDATGALLNRQCSTADYDRAVDRLTERGIRVVTHVIFGLPGEDRRDMLDTIKHICQKKIFGIKIHMLIIMKGTGLAEIYESQLDRGIICGEKEAGGSQTGVHVGEKENFPRLSIMSKEEYISTAAEAIQLIPRDITIHRLTGDSPADLLIAPLWSSDKLSILNGINSSLKKMAALQGSLLI